MIKSSTPGGYHVSRLQVSSNKKIKIFCEENGDLIKPGRKLYLPFN